MKTGGPSGRGSSSSSRRLQDRFERAGKAGDRVLAARDPEGGMAEGRWGVNAASKSHRSDLNRRPLDYESRALPLSYGGVSRDRAPNLAACRSTRYSTASARWRT